MTTATCAPHFDESSHTTGIYDCGQICCAVHIMYVVKTQTKQSARLLLRNEISFLSLLFSI